MREPEVVVKVKKLVSDAKVPVKAKSGDAAFDLCAAIDYDLEPKAYHPIPTGLALEIPEGYEGQVRPRSGLAMNHGITTLNTPGTVDSGYRGEVRIILINHGSETFHIKQGMRIAQLAIRSVPEARFKETKELADSQRGPDGFGSTGV